MQLYLCRSSLISNYSKVFVNQHFLHSSDLQLCLLKVFLSISLQHAWIKSRNTIMPVQTDLNTAACQIFVRSGKIEISMICSSTIHHLIMTSSYKHASVFDQKWFTWRAGADVDHLALGILVFVFYHECDGLHKHSILSPRLQAGEQDSRVGVFVWTQLHIHHGPAVWTTSVLTLKLCDVLKWPGNTV